MHTVSVLWMLFYNSIIMGHQVLFVYSYCNLALTPTISKFIQQTTSSSLQTKLSCSFDRQQQKSGINKYHNRYHQLSRKGSRSYCYHHHLQKQKQLWGKQRSQNIFSSSSSLSSSLSSSDLNSDPLSIDLDTTVASNSADSSSGTGSSVTTVSNVVDAAITKTSKDDNDVINNKKKYNHVLAILAMPHNSIDKIANEIILETILPVAKNKISIVLRCKNSIAPSVSSIRRYVGEIYSQLWDCTLSSSSYDNTSNNCNENDETTSTMTNQKRQQQQQPSQLMLPDVTVYAQNLPNSAPESWIDIQSDLDCICSHDFITGWTSSTTTSSSGNKYVTKDGKGGLKEHVDAVNIERHIRNLQPVHALPIDSTSDGMFLLNQFYNSKNKQNGIGTNNHIVFIDDEAVGDPTSGVRSSMDQNGLLDMDDDYDDDDNVNDSSTNPDIESNSKNSKKQKERSLAADSISFLSGPSSISQKYNQLFYSVAVGGTFDGLHYGHRKLLTLAISSVQPITGTLLIGVTVDDMLTKKQYSQYIPTFLERCYYVKQFVNRLAPGMINRIHILPIYDKFGPPGNINDSMKYKFDALVLSHETLYTGYELNQYRVEQLKLHPLTLLCTRRTESHGMSSTTLRRIRSNMVNNNYSSNEV